MRKKDQDKEKTRLAILAAARKLFLKNNFNSTSISDIAEESGIAKGTVYLYFKSKDEIFCSIMREFSSSGHARMAKVMDSAASEIDKIRTFIHEKLHFCISNQDMFYLIFSERSTIARMKNDNIHIGLKMMHEAEKVFLRDIIEAGQKTGRIKKMNSEIGALIIIGTLNSVLFSWMTDRQKLPPKKYILEVEKILSEALINEN